jgi:hypothetical protein
MTSNADSPYKDDICRYRCSECSFTDRKKINIEEHINKHHDRGKFQFCLNELTGTS